MYSSQPDRRRTPGEWRGGVDYDCATRDIFFCCMQSDNECLLSWFSAEVGGIQSHTLVADFKNKNSVSKSIKLEKFVEPPQKKDLTLSTHGSELDEAAWRQAGRSHAPDEQRAIERWKKTHRRNSPAGRIAP
ncbi:MAG: hypothetical protein IPG56_12195 [Caulobacteraceae bacterium]|nr:hypothetical protein [Caulobacteraceae bacterium]